MKSAIKIESITIKHILDTDPDFSFIGEYTDTLDNGVIVREYDEFYKKIHTEMERDSDGKFIGKMELDIPDRGREYRFFKPYAEGKKVGTKEYYEYGMQDYKRMERYNNQDWYFMGVRADAVVSYPVLGNSRRLETMTSGGLWGIESDSEEDYIKEVEEEQIEDLKNHLAQFCIEWDDTIEIEHKDE
jgi:hypothetical protein